jgi:hypothetical protein
VFWLSGRNLEHGYHIIGAILTTVIGVIIVMFGDEVVVRKEE